MEEGILTSRQSGESFKFSFLQQTACTCSLFGSSLDARMVLLGSDIARDLAWLSGERRRSKTRLRTALDDGERQPSKIFVRPRSCTQIMKDSPRHQIILNRIRPRRKKSAKASALETAEDL